MSRLVLATVLLSSMGAGVLIGRYTLSPVSAEGESPAESATVACTEGSREVDTKALRSDIRQILREEMRALELAPPSAPVAPAKEDPEDDAQPEAREARAVVPRSPEGLAAAQRGRQIVEDAIAERRWSEEDVLAIRLLLPQMAAEDVDALLHEIIPAINNGEVKLDTTGAIF